MAKRNNSDHSSRFKENSLNARTVEPDQIISTFFQNLGKLGQSKPNRQNTKRATTRGTK